MLVPPVVVTVTSTGPADPAGEVAVMEESEFTMKLVAGVEPKLTAVAPVKLVPEMATLVPPAVVPALGLILITVGGDTELKTASDSCRTLCEVTARPASAAPPRFDREVVEFGTRVH